MHKKYGRLAAVMPCTARSEACECRTGECYSSDSVSLLPFPIRGKSKHFFKKAHNFRKFYATVIFF